MRELCDLRRFDFFDRCAELDREEEEAERVSELRPDDELAELEEVDFRRFFFFLASGDLRCLERPLLFGLRFSRSGSFSSMVAPLLVGSLEC